MMSRNVIHVIRHNADFKICGLEGNDISDGSERPATWLGFPKTQVTRFFFYKKLWIFGCMKFLKKNAIFATKVS